MDLEGESAEAKLGNTVLIQEFKTLALDCNVNGVQVYWKKSETNLRRQRDGKRDILLEGIRLRDAGKYICYTRDDANVKLGAIDVMVYGKFSHFAILHLITQCPMRENLR